MELCIVNVICYIMFLCEGGLLFVLVEVDDSFKYVVKFWGVGYGIKVLIVELIGGEVV